MNEDSAAGVVAFLVFGGIVAVLMGAVAHRSTRILPSQIVQRLARHGIPVTFKNVGVPWDPSRPWGMGGIPQRGIVTYTLEAPRTIHVHFVAPDGTTLDRKGPIPDYIHPDSPESWRRRKLARMVVAAYSALGVVAFAIPASLLSGSPSVRVRVGALCAVSAVTIAWLTTHVVLSHRRANAISTPPHPLVRRVRHVLLWVVSLLVVSALLAVAWRLGDNGQPKQTTTSWPSAFINALIFVFACAAAIAASTHHHSYIHHTDSNAVGLPSKVGSPPPSP